MVTRVDILVFSFLLSIVELATQVYLLSNINYRLKQRKSFGSKTFQLLFYFIFISVIEICGKKYFLLPYSHIQGVTEIGALILTGNRTRQKEQLFYLPFCRKTMFNSKKKLDRFFTKIAPRPTPLNTAMAN
jgi:hypothetical protein